MAGERAWTKVGPMTVECGICHAEGVVQLRDGEAFLSWAASPATTGAPGKEGWREGIEDAARLAIAERDGHEEDARVYDGQGTPRAAERARVRASACQDIATRLRSLAAPSLPPPTRDAERLAEAVKDLAAEWETRGACGGLYALGWNDGRDMCALDARSALRAWRSGGGGNEKRSEGGANTPTGKDKV